jgi:hypothetical protein
MSLCHTRTISLCNYVMSYITGMDVSYKKKATGTLTASSTIDPDTFFALEKYPGLVKVPVSVVNSDGLEVTSAEVRLWISEKPKK